MADITGSPEQMMAAFKEVEKKRGFAKTCVSLAVLAVVLFYVMLIWQSAKNFKANRLPEFTAAMGAEMGMIAPKVIANVQGVFQTLLPQYKEAFQKSVAANWPQLESVMHRELAALQETASKQWPGIKQEINSLIQVQEAVVMTELKDVLTPADAERISHVYGEALKLKYDEILFGTMGKESSDMVANSKDIGNILLKMAQDDKEFAGKSVEMGKVVGILLELVGVQMQQAK